MRSADRNFVKHRGGGVREAQEDQEQLTRPAVDSGAWWARAQQRDGGGGVPSERAAEPGGVTTVWGPDEQAHVLKHGLLDSGPDQLPRLQPR